MNSLASALGMFVCGFAGVYLYLTHGDPIWIALDLGFVLLNGAMLITNSNSCEIDHI